MSPSGFLRTVEAFGSMLVSRFGMWLVLRAFADVGKGVRVAKVWILSKRSVFDF